MIAMSFEAEYIRMVIPAIIPRTIKCGKPRIFEILLLGGKNILQSQYKPAISPNPLG